MECMYEGSDGGVAPRTQQQQVCKDGTVMTVRCLLLLA